MATIKLWDGSKWVTFDAANAATLGGKLPTEFLSVAHAGTGGAAHKLVVTNGEAGFISGADKAKLDALETGAQRNQNTFAKVRVGTTILTADQAMDQLEFVAGSNITIVADEATDKLTISSTSAQNVIETTIPGGTEPYLIAKTNALGRVGDAEKIGGKALHELPLKLRQYESFAIATNGQSQFPINILEYEPGLDGVNVYQDGLRLAQGRHYNLSSDGLKAVLLGYTAEVGTEFQFVVLKKDKN